MNSGFADRGLTTWLPRRILLPELIRWHAAVPILSHVANFEDQNVRPTLRIVPYNGSRAYKYYLDGNKVNGKRKRLLFKDEAAIKRPALI